MSTPTNTSANQYNLGLPNQDIPAIDVKTGKFTYEWWPFICSLYQRVGGVNAPNNAQIEIQINNLQRSYNISSDGSDGGSAIDDVMFVPGSQGARGAQGAPGIPGPGAWAEDGEDGLPGFPGPQGLRGIPGPQGPSGLDGSDGDEGEEGVQGPPGPRGATGAIGLRGPMGLDGLDGEEGMLGPGPRGNQGIQGVGGSSGLSQDGVDGEDGFNGLQGPRGLQGVPGSSGTGFCVDEHDSIDIPGDALALTNFNTLGNPLFNNLTIRNNASIGSNATIGGTLGVTGAITPNASAGIVGTTAVGNANAGSVGEYPNNNATIAITTATATTITSQPLTAGDYDVYVNFVYQPAAGTILTRQIGSISLVTNAFGSADSITDLQFAAPAGSGSSFACGPLRVNVNTTTTVYAVAFGVFTVSTCNVLAFIKARRVR